MVLLNTYYHILGVAKNATVKEIKTSFSKLVKLYHPDLHGGDRSFERKLEEVKEAYEQLSNIEQRKKHDMLISKAEFQFNGESEPITSSSNAFPIQYDFITEIFHIINSHALLRIGLPFLFGIFLGIKYMSYSDSIPKQKLVPIEQSVYHVDFVYPERLSNKNFDEYFLNENTIKELEKFQKFLFNKPDYRCQIHGYFSNEDDLILIKRRINGMRGNMIDNGVNENQIDLDLKQVPRENDLESDPVSKDVYIQLFDNDNNKISSK